MATLQCEGPTRFDTNDGDYGLLLERAYQKSVKVLASPTGTVEGWQLGVQGVSCGKDRPSAGIAYKRSSSRECIGANTFP